MGTRSYQRKKKVKWSGIWIWYMFIWECLSFIFKLKRLFWCTQKFSLASFFFNLSACHLTVFCPLGFFFIRSRLTKKVSHIVSTFLLLLSEFSSCAWSLTNHYSGSICGFPYSFPTWSLLTFSGLWINIFIRTLFRLFFLKSSCCLSLPIISVLLSSCVCCQASYGHTGLRLLFL